MKESDLLRAVARATGESITRLRRIGFTLVDTSEPCRCLRPEMQSAALAQTSARAAQAKGFSPLPQCNPA